MSDAGTDMEPMATIAPPPELGKTMRVRVGQHRIRVSISGEGPPLLLINGIGGNIEMWRPLIEAMPHRQIIAFDMPGTGGSSTVLVPRPMYFMARITAALVRKLGYDKVDVLGVSWGGAAAQHLAVGFPGVVRRLVLCATIPGVPSVPGSPQAMSVLLSRRRYTDRDYLEKVAPTLYGGRIRSEPELLAEQVRARGGRPPSTWGYMTQLFSAMTFTNWPTMNMVQAPTLVMSGDDDPIVPLANARILAFGIPGAKLHVIEGGGHLFLHTSAPEVAPVIDKFLGTP
ncbi:MAG: alpha/beta fold hydrolase [Ilumatobacteraceae bacterium]